MVLVGDHRQLGAVDAGGILRRPGCATEANQVAELSDVRRFANALGEGSQASDSGPGIANAIAGLRNPRAGRPEGTGTRCSTPSTRRGRRTPAAGKTSLMIAGDRDTRQRAQRPGPGPIGSPLERSLGATSRCRTGDPPGSATWWSLSEQPPHRGREPVGAKRRPMDALPTHDDGSLTLRRLKGSGDVHLPADYVGQHVELAYTSTAHRAQGRTVDTLRTPWCPRQVTPRGPRRRGHPGLCNPTGSTWTPATIPDPQTSHGDGAQAMTACQVLVSVLANEGAELAAHEMIRRQHARGRRPWSGSRPST